MASEDDNARTARLRALKLGALVRDHMRGAVDTSPGAFSPGAALLVGDEAWVLLEDHPERGLGAALAWAIRQGARSLQVLAERETGLLARRAPAFTLPIDVWHVDERTLLPAVAEPLPVPPAPQPAHLAMIPDIEAGGATAVVEHGVVIGEVRGLEVCRVVDDTATGAVRLEVGVGVHDREAFAIIHGDVPAESALRGVVDAVAQHRRPGVVDHPLSRLVPERLLRWVLCEDPSSIGLRTLGPSTPPVVRPNVKDRIPCTAMGETTNGEPVLVVCSVGVDLDLVPYATDARASVTAVRDGHPGGDGEVGPSTWLVVPARDRMAITVALAERLHSPMTVRSAPA